MGRVLVMDGDAATRVRLTRELGEDVALFAESELDARAMIWTMPAVVGAVIDLDRRPSTRRLDLLH